MDALDELRHLLLRREQQLLRDLNERLEDRATRAHDIAGVLPQAIALSRDRDGGEDLSRALRPAVEASVRESIETRPQVFVEALHPIIGPVVRRALAESLRGLLQGLNQTLEHTFSLQGLKWRYEAMRTGRSFAEIVLLRSLVFRVEQIFLIHRETSLTLLHVAPEDAAAGKDPELLAGMLSAIQDFARDGFAAGADESLEEFRVGELQVWVAPGPSAFLAAVIRGNPARELRPALEEAIDNAHILRGAELAKFNGDSAPFEALRPELEACLRARYRQEAPPAGGARRNTRAWVALAAAGTVLLTLALIALQSRGRWHDLLRRLAAEPGLAVTAERHRWFGASEIAGLRDPLAADPADLARAAGVDPGGVRFAWKNFLALDAASVQRRFEQRFPVPTGARIAVGEDGIVKVAGEAPFEWLERVRREAAAQVPGVRGVWTEDATVFYDPARVRARFLEAFQPPPGVEARIAHGMLVLRGRAPDEWLDRVREEARYVPGIGGVVEAGVQATFDPARVVRRFTERFGLPDTVSATVGSDGVLTLSGEAYHPWIARLRAGAADGIPGVPGVREQGLTDVDQQTFQQTKSVIESAFIYFLPGKENFATEGFAALARLPEEVRRCQAAARRLGRELLIEVRGSADATGPEAKNVDLSQRRATAARDFLVSCGLDAGLFQPVGIGTVPEAPADKPAGEPAHRRVAFRVLDRLSSPPTP